MHSDLPKVLHPLAGKALLAPCARYRASLVRQKSAWYMAMAANRFVPPSMRRTLRGPAGTPARHRPCGAAGPAASCRRRVASADFYSGAVWRRAADPRLDPAAPDRSAAGRTSWRCSPRISTTRRATAASSGSRRGQAHRRGKGCRRCRTGHPRDQHRHPRRAHRGAGALAARLGNRNAQGEYYLTDIVALAVAEGMPVVTAHPDAGLGNRGREQQAAACRIGTRASAQHRRCA
jgi:hypothetical protein